MIVRVRQWPLILHVSILLQSLFVLSVTGSGFSSIPSSSRLIRRGSYGKRLTLVLGKVDQLDLDVHVTLLDSNVVGSYSTIQALLTSATSQWGDASVRQKILVSESIQDGEIPGYFSIERLATGKLNIDATLMNLLDKHFFPALNQALESAFHFDRNFYATIKATNLAVEEQDQFLVWMNYMPSNVLNGEKKAGIELNANDVANLYKTKRDILGLTNNNDLILFLGNTASYFYYTFNRQDARNVQLVPFSGKPFDRADSRDDSISIPKRTAYNTYLLRPIFDAWKRNGKLRGGRIVMVDHTRTGVSIGQFVQILEETGNSERDAKHFLINLEYASTPYARMRNLFDVELLTHLVVGKSLEDLERFDLGAVGRLVPFWGKEMWPLSKDWATFPFADEIYRARSLRLIRAGPIVRTSSVRMR